MKTLFTVVVGLLVFLSSSVQAAAERHAFVIGNSNYDNAPLKNPVNDATDMAAELTKLGYTLHRGEALLDLDLATFENELREFAFSLPKNAISLVYYAGHGISTNTDNYLIPIDAKLRYEEQLKTRAVSLRDTVALLNDRNREGLNVVLLDACRDSPLEKQFGRSLNQGLNRIGDLARGSFIGYSADEGQIAIDGRGRNGMYTGELLSALRESPGMPIQLLHNRVAKRVFEKTENTQYPQFPVSEQKFIGEYCIGPCADEQQGSFSLNVTPADAKVCFYQNDWKCGSNVKLPLGVEYPVYATAAGFDPFEGRARLESDGQVLQIEFGDPTSLKTSTIDRTATSTQAITQTKQQPVKTRIEAAEVSEASTSEASKIPTVAYVVAGALLVGALLASSGGSSGGGTTDGPGEFTINIPPLP